MLMLRVYKRLMNVKQQPDPVGDQLVNMVEHLEPEFSLRSCWRPNTEPKEAGPLDQDSSGLRDQIQWDDDVDLLVMFPMTNNCCHRKCCHQSRVAA